MPLKNEGLTAKERLYAKAIAAEVSNTREQQQNYTKLQIESKSGPMPSPRELMSLGGQTLTAGTVRDVPDAIQEMRERIIEQEQQRREEAKRRALYDVEPKKTATQLAGMQLDPADFAKVGGSAMTSGTAQSAADKLGTYKRSTQPKTSGPVKLDFMGVSAERDARLELLNKNLQQLEEKRKEQERKAATSQEEQKAFWDARAKSTGYSVDLPDMRTQAQKTAAKTASELKTQERELSQYIKWLEGQGIQDRAENTYTRQDVQDGLVTDAMGQISDGKNQAAKIMVEAIQARELGENPTGSDAPETLNMLRMADAMTDRQKDTMLALAGKGDWDGASRYLSSITDQVNQKAAKMEYENMKGWEKGLYWIPAGLEQFGTGVSQLGKSEATSPSVTRRVSQMVQQDAYNTSPALGFAYDMGTSISNMAPSILLSMVAGPALGAAGLSASTAGAVAGGIGSAALGASAGGNAYAEKKRQGYGDDEAAAYATLVGASEAGLQYVLGGISKLGATPAAKVATQVAKIDNAFGQAALRLGASMMSEGVEEGLQSVLEPAFATLILDEKYQVSPQEVVTSFIMGALTAGILEGPSTLRTGTRAAANGGFDTGMDGYLGESGVDYFRGVKNLEETQTVMEILTDYYGLNRDGADLTTSYDVVRQYAMRSAWYEGRDQARRATGQTATEETQQAVTGQDWTREDTAQQDAARETQAVEPEGLRLGAVWEDTQNQTAQGTAQEAQGAEQTARLVQEARETVQAARAAQEPQNQGGQFQRVQPAQASEPEGLTLGAMRADNEASNIQNLNEGAEINGRETEESSTAEPAGRDLSDGGQGRVYSESPGQQTGGLEEGPAAAAQTSEQSRAASERLARAANLRGQEVSSRQLGISRGTETANVLVMPREMWDAEMTQVAQEVQKKTGATVTYVMGGMEVTHTDGSVGKVRGVQMPGQIIVQADHYKLSVEQIANHEAFHELASRDSEMVRTAEERIKARYDADEYNAMVDTYIQKLQGVIDIPENATAEQVVKAYYQILEEIYADAYAGINAFGVQASQYQETVRELVQERGTVAPSRENAQATERTTGPTSEDEVARERFSTDDEEILTETEVGDDGNIYLPGGPVPEAVKRMRAKNLDRDGSAAYDGGNQKGAVDYEQESIESGAEEIHLRNEREGRSGAHAEDGGRKRSVSETPGEGQRRDTQKGGGEEKLPKWAKGHIVETTKTEGSNWARNAVSQYTKDIYFVSHAVLQDTRKNQRFGVTTVDGTVFLSDQIPDHLGTAVGHHEVVHVARRKRFAPYLDFLADTVSCIDRGEYSAQDMLDALADAKYDKPFMELSVDEVESVYDELNAYAWGFHRDTPERARELFKGVFRNYDDYIHELDAIMEQMRLDNLENYPVEDVGILTETAVGDDGNIYLPGGPVPEAVKRQRAKDEARSQETKWQEKFSVEDEEILTETEVGDDGNIYLPGGPVPEAVKRRREKEGAMSQENNGSERYSVDDESAGASEFQRVTPLDDGVEKATEESKPKKLSTRKKKKPLKDTKPVAESQAIFAKSDFRKNMMSLMSIPKERQEYAAAILDRFADRALKTGKVTEAERNELYTRLVDESLATIVPEELYQDVGRAISGGKVYVSDKVKAEFGDNWNAFKKRAYNDGIILTDNPNAPTPAQWNLELSEAWPGFFDPNAGRDDKEILYRMVGLAEDAMEEKFTIAEYTALRLGKKVKLLDHTLEGLERQIDWAIRSLADKGRLELYFRERTGKLMQQEREASAEARRNIFINQAIQRANEMRRRREVYERQQARKRASELQQKTLKQLQWLSKNRNKAPNELKKRFDEVLGDIDLLAVHAAKETNWNKRYQASWKDLRDIYLAAKDSDPNFLPTKELKEIVDRLDNAKLGDMDVDALDALYKAAVGLRNEYYNRNNMLLAESGMQMSEVYADSVEELKAAKKKLPGERGNLAEKADDFFNSETLTPMNVLQRMAGWAPEGAWHDMAAQLERGERDVRRYYVKANRMLEDFLKENEAWVKTADGQGKNGVWYELEVPQLLELNLGGPPTFGDTVKVYMTPAQKVHLYLESKNYQNLRHMAIGGRTFVNRNLYQRGKRQEAFAAGQTVKLAPETVRKIVSDLTEREMALANILERYYNDFAKQEMNRVSNILVGYDKASEGDYAPIYSNEYFTQYEVAAHNTVQQADSVGRSKSRTGYATNATYNISALDAFERHVNDMSRYVGLAIPVHNWKRLLSWKGNGDTMKNVITHQWGADGMKYIDELLEDIQQPRKPDSSGVGKLGDKLKSQYISSIFGLNPSIVLKQLGSIPLAMPYLGASNIKVAKIDREIIRTYTQDLDYRLMGYSMPATKILKENPGKLQTNKLLNFTFGGGAITAMDGWAASVLWPWAENKVRKERPDLMVGTQEMIDSGQSPFYKAVAEEFERAVSRSQSTTATLFSSRMRRSKNPFSRAFTLFKTDAAQGYNTIRQMVGEAQYYARKGDKRMANRKKLLLGQAVIGLLAGYLWTGGIDLLMELWKRQGDKYKDEEGNLQAESIAEDLAMGVVTNLFGLVPFAGEAAEAIAAEMTGEKWYGIEEMGLEQINEWVQYLQKAGGGLIETLEGAVNIVSQGGSLPKYLSDSSGKILSWIRDAAKATGQVFGVPVSNLETYSLGLMKWVSPAIATEYENMLGRGTKGNLKGLHGESLVARTQYILERRAGEVSIETAEQLAELYEAGLADAIPAEPDYKLKDGSGKREMTAAERQLYDAAWGEVGKNLEDLVQSQEFQSLDQDGKELALKTLYDYAKAKADAAVNPEHEAQKSEATIDTFLKEGGSIGEWATMKAGTKDMTSGDKYRAIAESDMSEDAKIAAIGAEMGTEMETASGNPSQYAKMLDALDEGATLEEYLELREAGEVDAFLAQINAGVNIDAGTFLRVVKAIEAVDDNGSITQAEAAEGLRNIGGLTNKERAELWQLQDKGWSAEKNPFSVDAGQRIQSKIQEVPPLSLPTLDD